MAARARGSEGVVAETEQVRDITGLDSAIPVSRFRSQGQAVSHGSDVPLLQRLAGIPVEPVFITGLHRSGTTLLYALLLATQRFNGVTAYHVLRYRQILARHLDGETLQAKAELAEQFRAAGILDRVIDGVQVT